MLLDGKVINNYVDSLFNLVENKIADDQNSKKQILQDLVVFVDLLKENERVKNILSSPIVLEEDKINLLNKIATEEKFSEISKGFLTVIVRNSRVEFVSLIVKAFEKRFKSEAGLKQAEVLSARQLSKELQKHLQKYLENKLGFNLELEYKIDESLIGGMVISYEGKLIDFSILGAINTFKKKMLVDYA